MRSRKYGILAACERGRSMFHIMYYWQRYPFMHLTYWKFQCITLEQEMLHKTWFASAFRKHLSSCHAIWHASGHAKLIILVINNLSQAVFYRQSLSVKWSTNPRVTLVLPTVIISLCALSSRLQSRGYFSKFLPRFFANHFIPFAFESSLRQ